MTEQTTQSIVKLSDFLLTFRLNLAALFAIIIVFIIIRLYKGYKHRNQPEQLLNADSSPYRKPSFIGYFFINFRT